MIKTKNRIGFCFSKKLAWRFFLVVVFPINFWALILWFHEFDNMAQRTNTWDAIGEGGYFLSYAFFESVVIFGFLWLLMLLLPKRWDQNKVFTIIGTLYLVIAGWFMLEQFRWLEFMSEENWLVARLQMASLQTNTGRALAVVFLISLIIPLVLLLKVEKLHPAVLSFLERIGMLSMLYLFLDFVGFMIVLIRII